MSGYGIVHRVTVYSGTSNSVQLFQLHSLAGFSNPYLSPPQMTGRRISVPECTAEPGQLTFSVLDKRQNNDQQDRYVTAFLGDSDGRLALRNSRVEYDLSDDGGQTFQREFTGRVHTVRQPNKNEFTFTVNDPRVDELNDVFDGTVPSVEWAAPATLLPLGIRTGKTPDQFGPWVGRSNAVPARVAANSGIYGATYYFDGIPPAARNTITEAFRQLASYTKEDPSLALGPGQAVPPPYAPDLRAGFTPEGESTERTFTVSAALGEAWSFYGKENPTPTVTSVDHEGLPVVRKVGFTSRDGQSVIPVPGTTGNLRVYSAAPPLPGAPMHIGVGTAASGVHWATLVSGLAAGAFGGAGFGIDGPRFNTLIADASQPHMRFRVQQGPVPASEWLERNIWPVVGYAPAVTASGTLYPVSYDPPSSLPSLTFNQNNTITATWGASRTGQINHVRFETVQEIQIPPDPKGDLTTDSPSDLLEEAPGDRIITARDAGTKRKAFTIRADGIRPAKANTQARQDAQAYARKRSEAILDRFQDGPQTVYLTARRTDATKGAIVGDHALVSVPWLVDTETRKRGGTRVMLILEKSVNPDGTYRFELLDNGPNQFVDAPTLTSVSVGTETRHSLDVVVTPPGGLDRAELHIATVPSGQAEPASGSELWSYVTSVSGTGQQTVSIGSLPARRRHWLRAIGRGPGKLPSSYTSSLNATTAAISPPTDFAVTLSGTTVIGTWTVGDANYGLMPLLSTSASGVSDAALTEATFITAPLVAGSDRFQWTERDPSETITVGVKHVDDFGGDSLPAKAGLTTEASKLLTAPRQLIVLQGRGDVDLGQTKDPRLGTGVELQVAVTEPYANLVLHYDTSSGFTTPTAISGIENDRVKVQLPLSDTTHFFRMYHQRDGWTTSAASETVSAKPVVFRKDPSLRDGFAGGFAYLTLDESDNVILTVGTPDPDVDAAYFELNTVGFVEPTTSSSSVTASDMPYSEVQDIRLAPGETAYLWLKFWSRAKGFGQGVKQLLPLAGIADSHGLELKEVARTETSVTYEVVWGSDVVEAWVYDKLYQQPVTVDTVPDDDATFDSVLVNGTDTQVTFSVPAPGRVRWVTVRPIGASGEKGWGLHFPIFPTHEAPDRLVSVQLEVNDDTGACRVRFTADSRAASVRYAYNVGTIAATTPPTDAQVEAGTVVELTTGVQEIELPAATVAYNQEIRLRACAYYPNANGTGSDGLATDHGEIVGTEAIRLKPPVSLEITTEDDTDATEGEFGVTVRDPGGYALDLYSRTKKGDEAWTAWSLVTADPTDGQEYTATVLKMEKHHSYIEFRLDYSFNGSEGDVHAKSNGFDFGRYPDIVIIPRIDEDNQTASAVLIGDADTVEMKVAASTSATPSASTVRGTTAISGRMIPSSTVGTLASSLTPGDAVFYAAFGYGPGGEESTEMARAETFFGNVAPSIEPTTTTESGITGTFGVTVRDTNGQADELYYQTRVGGVSWPESWTLKTAAPADGVEYSETVTLVEDHWSQIRFRLDYTLKGKARDVIVESPAFDPGLIPRVVLKGYVAANGNASAVIHADNDTASVKVAASTSAYPSDSTVRAETAINIPSGDSVLTVSDVGTLLTASPDDTVYWKAFAYTGVSGTGVESPEPARDQTVHVAKVRCEVDWTVAASSYAITATSKVGDNTTGIVQYRTSASGTWFSDWDGDLSDESSETNSVSRPSSGFAPLEYQFRAKANDEFSDPVVVVVPAKLDARILDATLDVDDDGSDEVYTLDWTVSTTVTDGDYKMRTTFYKEGSQTNQSTENSPSSTTQETFTDTGAGTNTAQAHSALLELIDDSGASDVLVDSKTVTTISSGAL